MGAILLGPVITVGAYIEAYYQVQAQNASNRLTNLRGFDNRSRTFTLSNVALSAKGESGPITTNVILQIGHTPSTYYLAEPLSPGTSSVDTSSSELWKYIQTATLSGKAPHELVIEAGVFLSPIGPEVIPIKDNWNWSRSNLFFGLPFYHTGVTLAHPLGDGWTGKLAVYNGWNSVVDNNGYPSVAASALYTCGKTIAQVMYFGGIERPSDSPLGKPWRNLFDAYIQVPVTDELSIMGHGDAGFERNDVETDWWAAGAVYAKLDLDPTLYVAVRGDYFRDHGGIFFPVSWVAEGTATLAYQPADTVSVRLEYRHDQAPEDAYFGGEVAIDAVTGEFIPDRESQDTVTLGATAWF